AQRDGEPELGPASCLPDVVDGRLVHHPHEGRVLPGPSRPALVRNKLGHRPVVGEPRPTGPDPTPVSRLPARRTVCREGGSMLHFRSFRTRLMAVVAASVVVMGVLAQTSPATEPSAMPASPSTPTTGPSPGRRSAGLP